MFIQQKLNPPPMDPMQAKIMQALPIVFTVFLERLMPIYQVVLVRQHMVITYAVLKDVMSMKQ